MRQMSRISVSSAGSANSCTRRSSHRLRMDAGKIFVENRTTGEQFTAEGYSPELSRMILAGGVMNDLDSFMAG